MNPWRDAWRTFRFIAAETCLSWALSWMPSNSVEEYELARFINLYIKRRV